MNSQNNISHYFENILSSIKNMEQCTQVFSQLHSISEDISHLEKYMKGSFATLDNHFQTYVQHIDLLSSLIDFQRKIIHFKTAEEMTSAVFSYIKENIEFDHAFIHLTVGEEEKDTNLILPEPENKELYEKFLYENNNYEKIKNIVSEKELGLLLSNVQQFESEQLPWKILGAKSVIIFPLRMHGRFFGFGILIGKEEPLLLKHLSFINLILGMLSLLLYQHFYFFNLKQRLFKQVKLQKVLEEVKYAEYFDKGPLFIYSLDNKGVILHANQAALENTKLHKENVIGEKFLKFLPEEHRKSFESILHGLGIGELQFYKCQMYAEDEFVHIWNFFITKMELNERFKLNIIFAVDVSQQYFKEQKEKRNEILGEIAQFSRIINGYLNNLLTVMIPNVSLLKSHLSEDDNLLKYLSTMEKSLNQTSGLVKKFINYDLEEIEQPKQADLNKLIKELVKRFKEKYSEEIEFKFTLDPGVPSMLLYSKRMVKLIKLLTQNSIEAMQNRGTVSILTTIVEMQADDILAPQMFYLPKGKYIELSVTDNGPGIKSDVIKHIFKPFFSTKIKNDGLGLGLFVAYNIVKDIDGEIFVKSEPGVSTTFYVYVPIKGEKMIEVPSPGKVETSHKKTPNILVVDDEYNIRSMLQEVLEMNGYEVQTAANGKEGIDLFDEYEQNFDLVILDMVMPVMDGKSTFREIKKRKEEQKIIIISGYSEREDLQEILKKGALAFMSKPFQINEIMKNVENALKN